VERDRHLADDTGERGPEPAAGILGVDGILGVEGSLEFAHALDDGTEDYLRERLRKWGTDD
jgi:hypothetical protein